MLILLMTYYLLVGRIQKGFPIMLYHLKYILPNFPTIDCDKSPPEQPVVIEAYIRHSPKSRNQDKQMIMVHFQQKL